MSETEESHFTFGLPEDVKKEYLEQRDTLEYAVATSDGKVKFGEWIVRFSGFLQHMVRGAWNLGKSKTIHLNGNKIAIDGKFVTLTDESVKMYLDIMHGVLKEEPDLVQTLELLRFLDSDGKLLFDFEKSMFDFYAKRLSEMRMNLIEELFTCMILKSFDHPHSNWEKNLIESHPWYTIRDLLWDCTKPATKKLGEVIVGKNKSDDEYASLIEPEVFKYIQSLRKYFQIEIENSEASLSGTFNYDGEHNGKPIYIEERSHLPTLAQLFLQYDETRWILKEKNSTEIEARSNSSDLFSGQWEIRVRETDDPDAAITWEVEQDFRVRIVERFPRGENFCDAFNTRKRQLSTNSDGSLDVPFETRPRNPQELWRRRTPSPAPRLIDPLQ